MKPASVRYQTTPTTSTIMTSHDHMIARSMSPSFSDDAAGLCSAKTIMAA